MKPLVLNIKPRGGYLTPYFWSSVHLDPSSPVCCVIIIFKLFHEWKRTSW